MARPAVQASHLSRGKEVHVLVGDSPKELVLSLEQEPAAAPRLATESQEREGRALMAPLGRAGKTAETSAPSLDEGLTFPTCSEAASPRTDAGSVSPLDCNETRRARSALF